jgi:protein-disulfide isomerase
MADQLDPRCGHCKALQPRLNDALKANPDVKLILKDYPVLGPNSILASRALLAAQKQDKYQVLQEALMELREDPNEQVLQRVPFSVGIDWTQLRGDMDDPEIQTRLQANVVLGQQLQVQGTPTMVIDNQLVPGAIDSNTLNNLLALARKAPEPQSSHS